MWKKAKIQLPGKHQSNVPKSDIITIIQKCQTYRIEYAVMKRLNFIDLKALIIEYDIDNLEKYLMQLEATRRGGVEVKEATNEDVIRFFGK